MRGFDVRLGDEPIRIEIGSTGAMDGSHPPLADRKIPSLSEQIIVDGRPMTRERAREMAAAGLTPTTDPEYQRWVDTTPNPFGTNEVTISGELGNRHPRLPSSGNISGMKYLADSGRTFETTGYIQPAEPLVARNAAGERITLTLNHPWVEKLIEGDGPKSQRYQEWIDMELFFSEDENRYKSHGHKQYQLEQATWCRNDLVPGDLGAFLATHVDYLQWLLSDDAAQQFEHYSTYHVDPETGAQVRDAELRACVHWNSKTAVRFINESFTQTSVFSWESPNGRFKLYIDAQMHAIYSFTFEQVNVGAGLIHGRIPGGFMDDFLAFKMRFVRQA